MTAFFQKPSAILPGLLVAAAIAFISLFIASHYGGPTLLYALLLGMAVHFLNEKPRYAPGIAWAGRHVLHIGVALLGARMGMDTFADLGWMPVILVVVCVAATIGFGLLLARMLGLPSTLGMLSGGATAICGASAALAISAILPKTPRVERQTLFTIIAVTTISTACMVLYPLLATKILGWEGQQAGILIGATIHDVAQVVGAGYMISDEAGDYATIVKLLRVAMLVPVCLGLAMLWKDEDATEKVKKRLTLPWFLVAFILLATVNSLHFIPEAVAEALVAPSRWCLVTAIAAIGMKTSLGEFQDIGWRPIALAIGITLFLLVLVLGALTVL